MPAVFTVPAVFKAVDKMSAPIRRMQKSVKGFGMSARANMQRASLAFTRFNNRVKSVGQRVKKSIGSLGVAFAGLALISALGGVINVFADFEQANASLASVMSSATQKELKLLQDDALRLGAITAKTSTEIVGLQEAFARLGFEAPDIKNMTQATIAGSIAMKGELADTAELVGAMVKSFDAFESIDAPKIIDQMTLSTQKSALNFEKLQTGLPIVSGAANAAGVKFTKLLASMGKLSDAGIDASSSSTALRNIFLEAAKRGVPYESLLKKVANSTDQLAIANELFGKRGAVAAVILAKNMQGVIDLDLALQSAGGTAEEAAKKQLNTLNGRLTILGSAWEGFVLSVESGNGKFATFLKTVVEVATEILALFQGTAILESKLDDTQKTTRKLANRVIFFLQAIKWVIAAYVAFRAIMLLTNAVLLIYNVSMGIAAALSGTAAIAIGQSTVAMTAYKIATGLVTAAQWLWNAALSANPIGIVIIAIIAMIAVVAIMIKKWDSWGAVLAMLLGPLGLIISLVQSFRRNWDMIKEAFKEGGIIGGLKAIGATILDALLMPIQQLFKLIAKIPGMGDKMKPLINKMQEFRKGLGVNVSTNAAGEKLNAQGDIAGKLSNENVNSSLTNLDIFNQGGGVVANDFNKQPSPIQQNNRVDLFLNNRSSDTEIFTEGTGVNVQKTGT